MTIIENIMPNTYQVTTDGQLVLSGKGVQRLQDIDDKISGGLAKFPAEKVELPRLMSIQNAEAVDMFRNFPHLALVATAIANPDAAARSSARDFVKAETIELTGPRYVLPSAACYGLYWALSGTSVDSGSMFSIRSNCFRQEKSVEGLARLVAFTMREIVCVGTPAQIKAFVEDAKETVLQIAATLGVEAELVPATDPFFMHDSSRAKMERIAPVKHELVSAGGVALASVNYHRNFFGERCRITAKESGEPAYTGCMAFGIERWLGEVDAQKEGNG